MQSDPVPRLRSHRGARRTDGIGTEIGVIRS